MSASPTTTTTAQRGLSGPLLRLHLKMWGRSLKTDRILLVSAIILTAFGLLGTLGMGAFSYVLIVEESDPRILPLTMAIGAMLYLLLVFVWPSNENHLDPRKFATLPVTAKQIFPGLTAAAFLQSRALLSLGCSLIMAGFGVSAINAANIGHEAVYSTIWVIACIIQGAMAVFLGEALGSLSTAMATRVWSERLGYAVSIIFLIVIMAFNFTANGIQDVQRLLSFGTVLAWTPFGAPAGAVSSFMLGNTFSGVFQAIIAIATIAACLWLWSTAIRVEMRHPIQSGRSAAQGSTGGLLLPWASPTPRGGVYSRSLRYWRRDSRYSYQGMSFVLIGMMFLILGPIQGSGLHWYSPFLIVQGVLMLNGNDFGLDGPANWVNMVAGVKPKDLIQGRLLASLTIFGPILLIVLLVLGAIQEFSPIWAGVCVLALCFLVQALGLIPAFALRFPFPTSKPGTSPMKNRSGNSSNAFILSMVGMLGLLIPMIPGAALLIFDLAPAESWSDITWMTPVGIAVQAVISGGLAWAGYRWALKNQDQRWPGIFNTVRRWL